MSGPKKGRFLLIYRMVGCLSAEKGKRRWWRPLGGRLETNEMFSTNTILHTAHKEYLNIGARAIPRGDIMRAKMPPRSLWCGFFASLCRALRQKTFGLSSSGHDSALRNGSPVSNYQPQVTESIVAAINKATSSNRTETGQTMHLKEHEVTPKLRFAKLTEHAVAPTRGSVNAAGYDLYSAYEYVVPARGKQLVMTDIQIAVPEGCYGRVAPRSGLAVKKSIDVGAGVIDYDYRGNVGVVLFNLGDEEFKVEKGDRIAQLICERIFYPELEECKTLDETERGAGGFGSTGTK